MKIEIRLQSVDHVEPEREVIVLREAKYIVKARIKNEV